MYNNMNKSDMWNNMWAENGRTYSKMKISKRKHSGLKKKRRRMRRAYSQQKSSVTF